MRGLPKSSTARMLPILESNVLARESACATLENVRALKTTTERHANVHNVPMIALDVEFAYR